MVDQHNHNVTVADSSSAISTNSYTKEIVVSGTNLGYYYFIDREHPLATGNSGRVLLHRHVASIKYGRWLCSDEHVHHIDSDKTNNHPDNLLVVSASEHNKIHSKNLEKQCKYCSKLFKPKESRIVYCSRECVAKSQENNVLALSKEVLDTLIPITTWKELGKMFGYSDVGIRDRAKRMGCNVSKRKAK